MLAVTAYTAALLIRIVARKYYVFLPDYARWAVAQSFVMGGANPTHVIFLFADHFEPGHDAAGTRQWIARYRALADRHGDHAGRRLQHTWFYPGEPHATGVLTALTEPVRDGYGEVELHYHHAFDTADSLRAGLQQAIGIFGRFGYLLTVDGRTRFAFVYCNSGLDNSNGPAVCGVSEELRLLRELARSPTSLSRASKVHLVRRPSAKRRMRSTQLCSSNGKKGSIAKAPPSTLQQLAGDEASCGECCTETVAGRKP